PRPPAVPTRRSSDLPTTTRSTRTPWTSGCSRACSPRSPSPRCSRSRRTTPTGSSASWSCPPSPGSEPRSVKIAIVTETFLPSVDGVVTRLRHAVERFTDLGHEVMVIAPDLGVTEHHGARVVGIRPVTLPFYKHRRFTLPSPDLDGILRGFHPDVVHAAQPLLLASSGAFAARRQRIPLVASYHTHIPRYLDLYRAWTWGKPAVWWQIKRNHAMADI